MKALIVLNPNTNLRFKDMKFKLFQMNKKQLLTMSLIAIVVTIFRAIIQGFIHSSGTSPFPPSVIVKAGMLPLAFMIFGIVTYGLLAILFFLIQDKLPGTRMKKGFIFGICFSMMWFIYLLEPLPFALNTSLIELLSYPIADGIALLLLGLLLGKFIGTDTTQSRKVSTSYRIITVASISLFFLLERYLGYSIFHVYSSFTTRPILTMIWTAATGIGIGIIYLLLSPGIIVKSDFLKALYFGALVIGVDLFFFNCFLLLVFDMRLIDMFIRTIIDVIPVTIGAYVAEKSYSNFDVNQSAFNQMNNSKEC